ncbi:MAG: hypothetical protein V9E92_07430 [Methylotenera sp.]
MVDEVISKICSRPECQVSKTGVCIEGHAPSEACPFFGQSQNGIQGEIEDDNITAIESTPRPIKLNRISLASGEALTVEEADQFLRWRPATFVTIVGERDSGKTTLICAVYDHFLQNKFTDYQFAGSRSLVGLEKRSHHARVESGRSTPDTARTSLLEGLRFLHFALVPRVNLQLRIDLMLSDRAGEHYQQARDNLKVVEGLIEVQKGQHIVLLMDGGRLADPNFRSGAMQSVRQTLRAFLDGGALSTSSHVQVVTTKIDLIDALPEKEVLNQRLTDFRQKLLKDFGNRLSNLSFLDICARDPKGKFPPAFGVDNLLSTWCTPFCVSTKREPPNIQLITEFDRLLFRTPMENLR